MILVRDSSRYFALMIFTNPGLTISEDAYVRSILNAENAES